MATKRIASDAWVRKVWRETNSIAAVAKRVGYSYVGVARRLFKLGLVDNKTAASK
jgi:hypothetical protein